MGRRVKMGSDYAALKKILYILTGLTCAGMVIADAFTKPAEGGEILINIVLSFFLSVSAVFYAGNLTDGVCRVSWEKADSSAGF